MSYLLQTPDQLAVHLRALRLAKGWSRIARIERDPLSISVDQMLKVLSILGASMRIELDASRSNLMLPSLQLAASGTVGSVSASQAGKTATKSEQGDW
jgi:hypothetical protein